MVNFLCLLLATTGGFLNVVARLALAYPDHQSKYCNQEYSPCYLRGALVANLLLQLLSSAANVAAGFFGPVSITLPTIVSSQLVFNMLLFGGLRLEVFEKTKRVGTLIVMSAAICLQVVGPTEQEDQDILSLLEEPYSIVWSILMGFLMIASVAGVVWQVRSSNKTQEETKEEAIEEARPEEETTLPPTNNGKIFLMLIIAQATATVISTSASKMWALTSGVALMGAVAVWFVAGVSLLYAVVVQSTEVNQSQFVPMSVTVNIFLNAVTGIIVWEDWRVVDSWVGYVCVFFQLGLGTYLLTELDLLHVYQERQGQALIPTGREQTPLVASVISSSTSASKSLQLPEIMDQLEHLQSQLDVHQSRISSSPSKNLADDEESQKMDGLQSSA